MNTKPKPALYAEDCNYWQTGRSDPDSWIDKSAKLLRDLGGKLLAQAFGKDGTGRAAYMLQFAPRGHPDGETYKLVWPVLPSRSGNERAARIQAATMMHHDIKARCVSSVVLGKRAAFFTFLQLPDGRVMSDVATPDLALQLPEMFRPKTGLLEDKRNG